MGSFSVGDMERADTDWGFWVNPCRNSGNSNRQEASGKVCCCPQQVLYSCCPWFSQGRWKRAHCLSPPGFQVWAVFIASSSAAGSLPGSVTSTNSIPEATDWHLGLCFPCWMLRPLREWESPPCALSHRMWVGVRSGPGLPLTSHIPSLVWKWRLEVMTPALMGHGSPVCVGSWGAETAVTAVRGASIAAPLTVPEVKQPGLCAHSAVRSRGAIREESRG